MGAFPTVAPTSAASSTTRPQRHTSGRGPERFRHDAGTTASSGCRHLGDIDPAAAVGKPAAGSAPGETESDLADLARLQALLALLGLEFHTLALCEVAEAPIWISDW